MAGTTEIAQDSKTKKETGIHGKYYERNILTLIALKCLLDEDIKDFWIISNPCGVDKFDDVILYVEYNNQQSHLYLIQIKHRKKESGKDRKKEHPLVAKMLEKESDKDLYLKGYEKAFESIIANKTFFETHAIDTTTKLFFILYKNCTVHDKAESNSISLKSLATADVGDFVYSKKSSRPPNTYKIVVESQLKDKEESAQLQYNEEFLKNFYFLADQLDLDQVEPEINKLMGSNDDITTNMINYFYNWAEPKVVENKKTNKLYKIDIKCKLLGLIFDNFKPPSTLTCSLDRSVTLETIKKFDITVISCENSENILWSDIHFEMENLGKQKLSFSDWETQSLIGLPEKLRFSTAEIQDKISIKDFYILMVANSILPLYIRSYKFLEEFLVLKLFPKLKIFGVVFNKRDGPLLVDKLKVFNTVNDFNVELFSLNKNKIKLSLQGKTSFDLFSILKHDTVVKQEISADIFFSMLNKTLIIGTKNDAPELQYYITRNIKVPIMENCILEHPDILFVICEIPSNVNIKKCCPLSYFFENVNKSDDIFEYLNLPFNEDIIEIHKRFNILSTPEKFNTELVKKLDATNKSQDMFCILQYIPVDSEYFFKLIYTNGPLDLLRPYLIDQYYKKDTELIDGISRVGIVCNNAGMGKSVLLKFLNENFSPEDWVIHFQLGKLIKGLKDVHNLDELNQFLCNYQLEIVDNKFHYIFKLLYHHYLQNRKLVWLIDDYEEINRAELLKLFIEACEKGIRIWIVARPFLREELENSFNSFSMELTDFSEDDQKNFFQKYFKGHQKAENILSSVEQMKSLFEDSFVGICQQTMMLAVIFESDEKVSTMVHRIDDLYEHFITAIIAKEFMPVEVDFIKKTISKLALYQLYSKKVLEKVFDWEDFMIDVNLFKKKYPKSILVAEYRECDIPIFSHRTYAEFLSARWLVDHVSKQIQKNTPMKVNKLLKTIYCQELTTVRKFFDLILTKKNPLFSAVITRDYKKINEIIMKDRTLPEETDMLSRTFPHILFSYGNRYDIHTSSKLTDVLHNIDEHCEITYNEEELLLDIPTFSKKSNNEPLTAEIFFVDLADELIQMMARRDSFLKLNVIDYALLTGSLAELDNVMNSPNDLTLPDMSTDTQYLLLYHCIKNNFNNILGKIDLSSMDCIKVRDTSQMSLLHLAVQSTNVDAIKMLASIENVECWGVNADGDTPLHLACEQKNDSDILLEILFEIHPFSVEFLNLKNKKGRSHLHCLSYNGHYHWVEHLAKYPDIEIDSKDNYGDTPFIASIKNKNIEIAKILKERGADISHENNKKMAALHYSAMKGFDKCTEQLLQWNANVDGKGNHGITPLILATIKGRKKTVKKLLECNANVNYYEPRSKWTALHHAIKRRKLQIMKILLSNNADVNFLDVNERSPLMTACAHNVCEAVKILLESENVKCAQILNKKSAMYIAVNKKHYKCADLLIKYEKRHWRPE